MMRKYIHILFFLCSSLSAQAVDGHSLILLPDRGFFEVGSSLELKGIDRNGTIVTPSASFFVNPDADDLIDSVIPYTGGRWVMENEGRLLISSLLPGGSQVTKVVYVDETPPVVKILDPPRASSLEPSASRSVRVKVTDAVSGAKRLEVEGQSFELSKNGNTEVSVPSSHGLNTIRAKGYDAADLKGQTTASFYESGGWLPFDNSAPLESKLQSGIGIQFGSEIFNKFRDSVENPNSLNQFMNSAVNEFNEANRLAGSQIIYDKVKKLTSESSEYHIEVSLKSIDFNNPHLSLASVDGGVRIGGGFYRESGRDAISAVFRIKVSILLFHFFEFPLLESDLVISMEDLNIDVNLQASKSAGEALEVDLGDLQLSNGLINIEADLPYEHLNLFMAPWVMLMPMSFEEYVEWVLSEILTSEGANVYERYEREVESRIEAQANHILSSLISSFDYQVTFSSDTLPWASTSKNINFVSELSEIELKETGAKLVLNTAISSDGESLHEEKPIITRNGCEVNDNHEAPFHNLDNLQLHVKLDLLNQLSHALWQGGVFDLTINNNSFKDLDLADYIISNFEASTFLLQPPIIHDCQSDDLIVELGDALVTAHFEVAGREIEIELALSMRAHLAMEQIGDRVRFTMLSAELLSYEVTNIILGMPKDKQIFETLIEFYLKKPLENELSDLFLGEIQMPSFEFDSLVSDVPFDSRVSVNNITVNRAAGHFYLNGTMF